MAVRIKLADCAPIASLPRIRAVHLPGTHRMATALSLLALFGWQAALAQALPTCSYDTTRSDVVVIDANNGNLINSKRNFPEGDAVELKFVHKNPYVYDYTYAIMGVSVDAATIRAFLEKIGALDAKEPDAVATSADAGFASGILGSCSLINVMQLRAVIEVGVAREGLSRTLGSTIAALNTQATNFDRGVDAINSALPTSPQSCVELRDQGVSVLAIIDNIGSLGNILRTTRSQLQSQQTALDNAVPVAVRRQMSENIEQGNAACQDAFAIISGIDTALQSNLQDATDAQANLNGKAAKLNAAYELISDTHEIQSAFVDVRQIGPVGEATDFSVSVKRTLKTDDDDSTTANAGVIRLGTPLFSYTLGASAAFADISSFGRAASVSDTGEVISVVEETDSSNLQWGLVGQLNARIGGLGEGKSWGWSLGVALSEESDGTDLQLYTGPFVSLNKRWLVTAALFASEETKLASGFKVGDEIPSDFQGDVPTKTETNPAIMITITYDFQ